MLEKALLLFGLNKEKILDYEDVCNSYIELLDYELDNMNIENIYKIIISYKTIYSFFYPEYEEQKVEQEEQSNLFQLVKMICITKLIEEKLDKKNKNDQMIISLLEQNLKRDYWARTQNVKKLN